MRTPRPALLVPTTSSHARQKFSKLAPVLVTVGLGLVSTDAFAHKLLGASWNVDDGPVTYALHPDGSDDVTDGSDLEAVRNSFRSWACIEGSRLRVNELDVDGPNVPDGSDGINTVFWDETGTVGMGPGTLGVTIGDAAQNPDQPITRMWADIAFNGVDHTWSTGGAGSAGVDIESVSVHEAGHFMGLDHPCTDIAETDCLGPDQSVMTPALPDGAVIRKPFTDDENGIKEMYPQAEDDESTCEGPFRQGEACLCNDECVSGLSCTPVEDGDAVCVPSCADAPLSCPSGFACILGPGAEEGDPVVGACVATDGDGLRPPAAVCSRDTECQQGVCGSVGAVAQFVCRKLCEADDDCGDGYSCVDEVCLAVGAAEGLPCPVDPEPEPEPEEPACACASTTNNTEPLAAVVFAAATILGGFRRRRSMR